MVRVPDSDDGGMSVADLFRRGMEDGSTDRMIALSRRAFDELSDEQIGALMLRLDAEMEEVDAVGPMSFLMMFAGTYIQQEGKRRFCGDKS